MHDVPDAGLVQCCERWEDGVFANLDSRRTFASIVRDAVEKCEDRASAAKMQPADSAAAIGDMKLVGAVYDVGSGRTFPR